ncbi:IS1595 family transposase [candidate division WOR-3 bacterium]|nr:IS1595 family transposase [candidate division WOR-3 bacterium]
MGGKRKGKRGRGAKGKTPVFGMIERNGKVIVEVVPDVSSDTLRAIIKERVSKDARVYTDKFRSYNYLIINGYDHIKIDKEKTFANGKSHINSIESFWAYAKERLIKYHGITPRKLYLYMKELELRFNNRNDINLEDTIFKYLLDFWHLTT